MFHVKHRGGKTIRCFETEKLKMAQATGQQIITQATALAPSSVFPRRAAIEG